MYHLESKLCEIRLLQVEAAKLMEQAIQAYKWPVELAVPTDPDEYGTTLIAGQSFGQDFPLEWACAQGCSQTSAYNQIADTMVLIQKLPRRE